MPLMFCSCVLTADSGTWPAQVCCLLSYCLPFVSDLLSRLQCRFLHLACACVALRAVAFSFPLTFSCAALAADSGIWPKLVLPFEPLPAPFLRHSAVLSLLQIPASGPSQALPCSSTAMSASESSAAVGRRATRDKGGCMSVDREGKEAKGRRPVHWGRGCCGAQGHWDLRGKWGPCL